jgi:hypothetical protein
MQFFIDNWYLSGIIIAAVILLVAWIIMLIMDGIDALLDTPDPLDEAAGFVFMWVLLSAAWPVTACAAIAIVGAILVAKFRRVEE